MLPTGARPVDTSLTFSVLPTGARPAVDIRRERGGGEGKRRVPQQVRATQPRTQLHTEGWRATNRWHWRPRHGQQVRRGVECDKWGHCVTDTRLPVFTIGDLTWLQVFFLCRYRCFFYVDTGAWQAHFQSFAYMAFTLLTQWTSIHSLTHWTCCSSSCVWLRSSIHHTAGSTASCVLLCPTPSSLRYNCVADIRWRCVVRWFGTDWNPLC